MRAVEALEDATIGDGKYFIPKGSRIAISTRKAQCDPKIWGEDVRVLIVCFWCKNLSFFLQAREYRPETMYGEHFVKVPVSLFINANWKRLENSC